MRTDVYALDTKIQLNKFRNEILELKVNRLNKEGENQKGNGKGFMGTKSYQDYVKNKVTLGEK